MAETRVVNIRVQTTAETQALNQYTASIEKVKRDLAALKKAEKAGTITAREASAQRAQLSLSLKANKNALRDVEAQVLKNNNALRKNSGFVKGVSKGMINAFKGVAAAAAAAFSIGAIKSFISESIKAFDVQAKAEKSLLTALGGRANVQQRLIAQAQTLQQTTLFGDEETIKAQSILAQLGATEEQITKLIPAVQDFAAAQGISLADAANLVAKSTGSSTNALSRYGIAIEGAAGSNERAQSAVDALTTAFGGQAAAAAQTGLGPITQLSNAYGDLQEGIGGVLVPSGRWIGTLQRITENTTALLTKPMSDELKLQAASFNSLTKEAMSANTTEEERVELLKQAQAQAPGFLAGLDLESATQQEIAAAVEQTNRNYERRLQLQLAIEAQSIIQADIDQSMAAIAERQLILDQQRIETQNGVNASRQEENIIVVDLLASWADISGQQFLSNQLLAGANELEKDLLESNQERLELQEQAIENYKEENRIRSGRGTTERAISPEELEKQQEERLKQQEKLQEEAEAEYIKRQEELNKRINEANLEADRLRIEQIEDQYEREEALAVFNFEQKIAKLDENIQAEADLIKLYEEQLITEIQEIRAEGDMAEIERREMLDELFKAKQLEQEQEEIDRLERMDEVRQGFADKFQKQEEQKKESINETLEATAQFFGAASQLAEAFGLENKGLAMTEAIIATYLGATKALTPATPADALTGANFIRAAAVIAAGLANIAKINAAADGIVVPEFNNGGMLKGPSHAGGGINMHVKGVPVVNAEGGEGVINKRSMANPMLRGIASWVNQMGGGVAFENGGVIPIQRAQLGTLVPSFTTPSDVGTAQATAIQTGVSEGMGSIKVINVADETASVAGDNDAIRAENVA